VEGAESILKSMYLSESDLKINTKMKTHTHFTIANWIYEVATDQSKMDHHAGAMAINIFMQFMSTIPPQTPLTKRESEIAAFASIMLGAKIEHVHGEFRHHFIDKQVITMETRIANAINYNFTCPTAFLFVWYFESIIKLSTAVKTNCELLVMRCMCYPAMYRFKPSEVANSSIYEITGKHVGNVEPNKMCDDCVKQIHNTKQELFSQIQENSRIRALP
jgi:hypothetical protein